MDLLGANKRIAEHKVDQTHPRNTLCQVLSPSRLRACTAIRTIFSGNSSGLFFFFSPPPFTTRSLYFYPRSVIGLLHTSPVHSSFAFIPHGRFPSPPCLASSLHTSLRVCVYPECVCSKSTPTYAIPPPFPFPFPSEDKSAPWYHVSEQDGSCCGVFPSLSSSSSAWYFSE